MQLAIKLSLEIIANWWPAVHYILTILEVLLDTLLNILKLNLSLGHLVLLAQLAELLLALVCLSVCFRSN